MMERFCKSNSTSRILLDVAESMGFRASFANGRTCCGSEIDQRVPIAIHSRMSRWIPELETACFTEENGLPPRKHDLFSVLEQKNEVSVTAQSWLFDLAEVDNTASVGSKEVGTVQTALTLLEGAPHEKLAVGKMD
jgi:hypothetical protein